VIIRDPMEGFLARAAGFRRAARRRPDRMAADNPPDPH